MTREEDRTHNCTYKKLAVQCSADAFAVNQTLFLRMNICGENRQPLVAANRWQQCPWSPDKFARTIK